MLHFYSDAIRSPIDFLQSLYTNEKNGIIITSSILPTPKPPSFACLYKSVLNMRIRKILTTAELGFVTPARRKLIV